MLSFLRGIYDSLVGFFTSIPAFFAQLINVIFTLADSVVAIIGFAANLLESLFDLLTFINTGLAVLNVVFAFLPSPIFVAVILFIAVLVLRYVVELLL